MLYYRNIEEKKSQYSQVQQHTVSQPHSASEILTVFRNKGFRPYELTKTCLADVNVIALSYFYVFEPTIRTAFLKNLDFPLEKTILIARANTTKKSYPHHSQRNMFCRLYAATSQRQWKNEQHICVVQ